MFKRPWNLASCSERSNRLEKNHSSLYSQHEHDLRVRQNCSQALQWRGRHCRRFSQKVVQPRQCTTLRWKLSRVWLTTIWQLTEPATSIWRMYPCDWALSWLLPPTVCNEAFWHPYRTISHLLLVTCTEHCQTAAVCSNYQDGVIWRTWRG